MELGEADFGSGGGGDGGAEVFDVARGVGDGDGENRGSPVDEIGEFDEGDEMAVGHERKHEDMVVAGDCFGTHFSGGRRDSVLEGGKTEM